MMAAVLQILIRLRQTERDKGRKTEIKTYRERGRE